MLSHMPPDSAIILNVTAKGTQGYAAAPVIITRWRHLELPASRPLPAYRQCRKQPVKRARAERQG